MKTFKLLIKTSFFNKINVFLCFDIIKYIFDKISNKVFISYIIKIKPRGPLLPDCIKISLPFAFKILGSQVW